MAFAIVGAMGYTAVKMVWSRGLDIVAAAVLAYYFLLGWILFARYVDPNDREKLEEAEEE